MDPHLNSKLTAATIKIYRLRAGRFMAFIIASKLHFRDASELDDLIVEYKNSVNLSKSEFDGTIAAVEHVLPHCKGGLRWAHAVSKAWAVTATPSHTVPLCEGPCLLLACHMAARGHARLGVCFILQNALGLRPSEGLGLEFDDVLLPEDRGLAASAPTVVGLGVRTGTKAKRAQAVTLSDPRKVALLRWLKQSSSPGDRLVGYTYEQSRRILAVVCKDVGLSAVGFTPHSPRAGFATECVAAGLGLARTRELGRWVSETSCRTYLDVVTASSIQATLKSNHLQAAQAYCGAHLLSFFIGSASCLRTAPAPVGAPAGATDAAQGHQAWPGRPLLPGRAPGGADERGGPIDISEGLHTLFHAAPSGRGRGRARGRPPACARGRR